MNIMDDYKQLRMIENIKNFKEMEIAYKANLKLCKYQEQQINKLATCIEQIKDIARQEIVCDDCNFQGTDKCDSRLCTSFYLDDFCKRLLQKISECEV